ncbi:MAG: VOC family protein [Desulfovibrio sp.]|nr:VOC family protein [Desulfovibrio sp.]MBI4960576.1 VOC family protein [Desulfovibrio sp.]
MALSFEGPAVMVRDMASCRAFYENLLDQKVLFAVGDAYTAYASKFSLWEATGAHAMIFGNQALSEPQNTDAVFELYFESSEIESELEKMRVAKVPFIHELREQPWGQRCFRVRDPEGRIVEIGEPMPLVAKRFLAQGLSFEEVSKRTMLPVEIVRHIAGE